MISYHDDHYLLEASSVEATFSDETTVQLDEITVHPFTPMGHEFVLSDGTNNRIVRLILEIHPRTEQDYLFCRTRMGTG